LQQHPDFHNDSFTPLQQLKEQPNTFKTRKKYAVKLSQQHTSLTLEAQHNLALIKQQAQLAGIKTINDDNKDTTATIFACNACNQNFTTFTGLCSHQYHKHRRVKIARLYAYHTHCTWCLKQYHCRWRLICHLQFSGTKCLDNIIATHTPLSHEQEQAMHNDYKQQRKQTTNMAKTNKATNRLPCIKLHGPKWEHPDDYNNSKTLSSTTTSNSSDHIAQPTTETPKTQLNIHTSNHQQTIAKWLAVELDHHIEYELHNQIIAIAQNAIDNDTNTTTSQLIDQIGEILIEESYIKAIFTLYNKLPMLQEQAIN
jgi:hypothetical protein